MQTQRRARLIAADKNAEPVARVLRIIGAALNGAILFPGELG
jgi:hypothetical protein